MKSAPNVGGAPSIFPARDSFELSRPVGGASNCSRIQPRACSRAKTYAPSHEPAPCRAAPKTAPPMKPAARGRSRHGAAQPSRARRSLSLVANLWRTLRIVRAQHADAPGCPAEKAPAAHGAHAPDCAPRSAPAPAAAALRCSGDLGQSSLARPALLTPLTPTLPLPSGARRRARRPVASDRGSGAPGPSRLPPVRQRGGSGIRSWKTSKSIKGTLKTSQTTVGGRSLLPP